LAFVIVLLVQIFAETELEDWQFAIGYVVLFILSIASFLLVEVGFKRKAYLLREYDLLYKTGYLMQKMTAIPKNRIQHVEIRQSVLLRLFKLSKLVIYTAGGSSSDLSISGLKPEDAEILKEHISKSVAQYE